MKLECMISSRGVFRIFPERVELILRGLDKAILSIDIVSFDHIYTLLYHKEVKIVISKM